MSYILAYSGKHSIEFIRNILGEGGWVGVILTTAILMIIVFGMFKIDWEKIFKKYLAKEVKDD